MIFVLWMAYLNSLLNGRVHAWQIEQHLQARKSRLVLIASHPLSNGREHLVSGDSLLGGVISDSLACICGCSSL